MPYTTITQKWQMTLPKDIRTLLGLKNPGRVFIEADKKTKSLKIKKAESIFDLAGKFKPKKAYNAVKLREMMENNYERF
ncbi:hypothetical protein AUJ29_03170 [Candidatus Kuenenbacteria bacterium CG1_02_38_13]|uniref:SpoVT-AbrB domain-containing protein n=2 Tax=Parcubacteria group TaxID=1794811 RepID=A0A1J4U1J9_9BACT|nr:MAG: hypothetical protein AUJ29_03170 [Candidatus Kuenenbacteria bacterium CG1_02_38_13]